MKINVDISFWLMLLFSPLKELITFSSSQNW